MKINMVNLSFLEDLYAKYLQDESSIPDEWKHYFGQFYGEPSASGTVTSAGSRLPRFQRPTEVQDAKASLHVGMTTTVLDRLRRMIEAYRGMGHWIAKVNPLQLQDRRVAELDPGYYGFTSQDWQQLFPCTDLGFSTPVSLHEIIERLQRTFCGPIGVEFMHLRDQSVKRWLQERMESTENQPRLERAQQQRILARLTDATIFEQFIRRKFLGAKSFSIEGAESLIPLLDRVIEHAAGHGLMEIVFAMAHRGRLNVLANIIGKKPSEIFYEFVDPPVDNREGSGDVKYHLGHSNDYETASGRKIHLSLCFNPSHLEFVNPVALGRIRAKQDRIGDVERGRGMALLIHGDAGFAGEGIVQETLNFSQLDGYTVGGTLHVIINNQIGFTTPPGEGRSSAYATDIAKMLDIPIFHVNGDDPEAIATVVELAMEWRKHFGRDVVIDMYCYRRWGHNESDEPSFTQPMLYRVINQQKTVQEQYLDKLIQRKCISQETVEKHSNHYRDMLEVELKAARCAEEQMNGAAPFRGVWNGYHGGSSRHADEPKTVLKGQSIAALLGAQTDLPETFHAHPKIARAIEVRRKMAQGRQPLDWSAAEALAFASIASMGIRVRLSGQDSGRGTFSQRHAILYDVENGRSYIPLQQISAQQAPVEILNSPLSEAGVLGFEYGYSLDCPDGLVVWEAQFGDFSNAAQVIVDQFIASAEEKWRRLSGLVMLLPHGFEGMGPEHSSARIERFLQLGAHDNIQVVYPTSPSQYFHCLRRQALRKWRKPLVVLTPKSMLRHPQAVSRLEEFSDGQFEPIIQDHRANPERVKRILLCSGKLFYELDKARRDLPGEEIAILRLEQLYPLTTDALKAVLEAYPPRTPVYWVQEEPENMGAWCFLNLRFQGNLFDRHSLMAVCRPPSASPATGWKSVHAKQQRALIDAALGTTSRARNHTSDSIERERQRGEKAHVNGH